VYGRRIGRVVVVEQVRGGRYWGRKSRIYIWTSIIKNMVGEGKKPCRVALELYPNPIGLFEDYTGVSI